MKKLVFITFFLGAYSSFASWRNFRQNPQNNAQKEMNIRDVSINYDRKPWSFQTDGLVWGTPVGENGIIYVGSASKKFFALNEVTGKKIWEYQIFDLADSLIDSAAALDEDLVVIPGGDGYLHAVDKKSGQRRWVFKAHHQSDEGHQEGLIVNSFEGNVTIGPNGHFYAGSDNGHMYCVDKSGNEVWSFKTGMMIWSSPAFHKSEKLMIFGSLDRHLYVLNYETGKLIQKINLKSEVKSSPVIKKGAVYVGTSGGKLFKFNVNSEELNLDWIVSVNDEIYSSPVLIKGKVIFGSLNGYVYGLEESTGNISWRYDTFSSVSSSPVGTKDGVVIFGAKNGKLYSLDASTGERIWSFKTSDKRYKINLDSSPMITDTGSILIGSYNGNIYRVPYEYCFNHIAGNFCEYDGKSDPPNYITGLGDGDHFLFLKRDGEYVSANGIDIKRSSIVKLKYVSIKNGKLQKNQSLSPINSKVWINGYRYKNIRVSADGKFLNLIVPKQGWGEGIKNIKIRYGTYERSSWLLNRIKMFLRAKKTKNLILKVNRDRLEGERRVNFNKYYNQLISGKRFLGVRNLFLFQPSSLETYIPAAMDGQQFMIRLFELDSRDIEVGIKIGALALPAIYSDRVFSPMMETARTFQLDVNIVDQHFLMSNPFYLSAMGGGINFSNSLFEFTFENSMGNFYASASCLKIKGNGESYKFPIKIIDNTCDQKLRISAFGKMRVTDEIFERANTIQGRARVFGKKVKVSFRQRLTGDKLVTLVYLKKNKIHQTTKLMKANQRSVIFEFNKRAPETYKIFMNLNEVKY